MEQLTSKGLAEVNSVIKGQKFDSRINLKKLHVSDKYRDNIEPLILKDSDLFASTDTELGHTNTVRINIDTGSADPIKLKPYQTPLNNRKIIDETIDDMLDTKVIRRSKSPWSFPVVIVDNKDGSKRFCSHFRKLNQVTKKNSCPLPVIDGILDLLGKAKCFTSFDLKSVYWQVLMNESEKEKTAFACHCFFFLVQCHANWSLDCSCSVSGVDVGCSHLYPGSGVVLDCIDS